MSRSANWNGLLDSAKRISAPGAIQLVKRSATRPPHPAEAMAITLSALGALDRHTGVHTMNLKVDGQPVALALIKGASFSQDEQGTTTLFRKGNEDTP